MNQDPPAVFTARDMEDAKMQGTIAGEMRALKWGAGLAIAAILGALGLLYQNQTTLHERVARVEQRIVAMEQRIGAVEERVMRVEQRLDDIDKQLATISSQLATLISAQNRSR